VLAATEDLVAVVAALVGTLLIAAMEDLVGGVGAMVVAALVGGVVLVVMVS